MNIGIVRLSFISWGRFDDPHSAHTLAVKDAKYKFERPSGSEATKVKDLSLLYFTSGIAGMTKMDYCGFSYPLCVHNYYRWVLAEFE